MKPPGLWGPKEFAQFTEDELHETMMGAEPGSNYFEWAKAELEHRDRKRVQSENRSPTASPMVARSGLRTEKTVFISYRRTAGAWAQSIFQDLTQHGFDVFFDFNNIASGSFEDVILENIKARAHFLVLLTPTALDRCGDPNDLFRREIETVIANKRNVIPIFLEGFEFGPPEIDRLLGQSLAHLKRYNGLPVYPAYVGEAMQRLREKFLNVELAVVAHPASSRAEAVAKKEQEAASKAPPVTENDLKQAALPRYVFKVKLHFEDAVEQPEGTRAEEPHGPGTLIVYDGDLVVARYNQVERWSRQRP